MRRAIDVGSLPRQQVGGAVVDAVDHGAQPDALCGDSQCGQGGPAVGVGGGVVVAPVGVDAHRLHPLHQSDETLPIRRLGEDADAEADPVLPLGDPGMRSHWHRGQVGIDARRLGHQGSLRQASSSSSEIDLDSWQGYRRDHAAAMNGLLVAPVWLPSPGGQCSLVGVNAPDFQITALLVDRHFGIDVVVSGRRRPDFDHQWQRIGKDRQHRLARILAHCRQLGTTMRSGMKTVAEDRRTRRSMKRPDRHHDRVGDRRKCPRAMGICPCRKVTLASPPTAHRAAPKLLPPRTARIADRLLRSFVVQQPSAPPTALGYRLSAIGFWLLATDVPEPLQFTVLQLANSRWPIADIQAPRVTLAH